MTVRVPVLALLALVAILFVGGIGVWRDTQHAKRLRAERDSLAAVTALKEQQLTQLRRAAGVAAQIQRAQAESTAVLEAAYKALRRTRPVVDTQTIPDTGAVPVAVVRAEREGWIGVVAHLDSTLRVADRTLASKDRELAAARQRTVADSTALVIEHDLRVHWQALAVKATRGRAKFWIIPLPDLNTGCGVGVQFTGKAYSGCGAQLGYSIHF